MQRPLGVVAALVCVALLAGCGVSQYFGLPPTPTEGPAHVLPSRVHDSFVNVYFCTKSTCAKNATRSEEQLVGQHLRREPCVRRVVFTSRAQALAKFRKHHPKVVAALPRGVGNPLPASFSVTPANPSCLAAIVAAARAAHWPGVQQVQLARRRL